MRFIVLIFLILSLLNVQLCAGKFSEPSNEPWGADKVLAQKEVVKEKPVYSLAQKGCKAAIRFFQVYISPIDGPRSSYYPSSSQYTLEAIQKYGVFKGVALGCDRLMRENKDLWVYDTEERNGVELKSDPVR